MNCPNCGAPMALSMPGAPWNCTHCGTTLRPDPGEPVDVRVVGDAAHECPVCRRALARAILDDRETAEYCRQCEGILMARRAFAQTVIARRAIGRAPGVTPPAADPREMDRRLACPQCREPMLTDWYYGPGGIIVDTCPSCDVIWLDGGELKRAIDAPGGDRRP